MFDTRVLTTADDVEMFQVTEVLVESDFEYLKSFAHHCPVFARRVSTAYSTPQNVYYQSKLLIKK